MKVLKSKFFTKTAFAISLSVVGVVSSMSALAMATDGPVKHEIVQEIIVDNEGSKEIKLFISVDGEMTNLTLPHSALENKEQLSELLTNVPDNVREKLLKSLTELGHDDHVIHIRKGHNDALHWVSEGDDERVVMIEMGEEQQDSGMLKRVLRSQIVVGDPKVIKVKHGKHHNAEAIMNMLEHGSFDRADLDKIKQALDAKR